jgi:hypothetical protein
MEKPRELSVRGGVIKESRDLMRTAYGADAYRRALNTLSPEERAIIDGPILAASWYSLATWDRFQAAMRAEARTRAGETELEFDMRNLRESGPQAVRSVYKFLLGLMSSQSALDGAAVVWNRAYSEGRCQVVENEPGRAVLRYCDCSPAFRTTLIHHFPAGTTFALELSGAKNVDVRISRDEVVNDKLTFEVTATYRR